MARRLDAFPEAPSQRYPWSEWLDGGAWELTKGQDYEARTSTIIANARSQAKRRGGNLRTRTLRTGEDEAVAIQFVRP